MKIDRYNELMLSTKDVAYRVALSLVGNAADAEDVTQDIYEMVWRRRDEILSMGNPRAYVLRSVRNLCLDRFRAVDRHDRSLTAMGHAGERSADYSARYDARDQVRIVERIIAQLPERQRLAIHLRDVEQWDIDEIAEVTQSDETSVRMNLSRARRTVREELLKIMNYGVQ